jgi:hypothetical protein
MHWYFVAAGAVIGLPLGLSAAWALRFSEFSNDALANLFGAIVGAALTVSAAAAIAAYQSAIRIRAADEQRKREQLAARAVMALDLSRIAAYAKNCARIAKNLRRPPDGGFGWERAIREYQSVDTDIIESMRRLVAALAPKDADQVVALLNSLQVQSSRFTNHLNALADDQGETPDFDYMMAETVVLTHRVNRMFPFARQRIDHIQPPPFSKQEVTDTLVGVLDVFDYLTQGEREEYYGPAMRLVPASNRESGDKGDP